LKVSSAAINFPPLPTDYRLPFSLVFAWLYLSIALAVIGWGALAKIVPQPSSPVAWRFDALLSPTIFGNLLSLLVLPLMVSLLAFGVTIFPRIPYAVGGGEPRPVFVRMNVSPDPFKGKELLLIGESAQLLFVIAPSAGGSAFEINKERVDYVETRRPTGMHDQSIAQQAGD
jgi:hypothetical protein